MRTVKTLIDEAINVCLSQSELGRKLGITAGDVNDMARGRRPVSPATVGLLCDLLELDGVEAQRLAAEAIIASAKGGKQGVLRRAFFARSGTGAVSGVEEPIRIGEAKRRSTKAPTYTLWRVPSSTTERMARALARGCPPLNAAFQEKRTARRFFNDERTLPGQ